MPQHMPLGILVSMTAAWKGSLVRVPGVPTKAVVRVIKLLFYKARPRIESLRARHLLIFQ